MRRIMEKKPTAPQEFFTTLQLARTYLRVYIDFLRSIPEEETLYTLGDWNARLNLDILQERKEILWNVAEMYSEICGRYRRQNLDK